MLVTATCTHCRREFVGEMPTEPATESTADLCSPECSDAYWAARYPPGYWTPVGDLTVEQRAELDAMLGKGAKA